jgi:hypothetical protein
MARTFVEKLTNIRNKYNSKDFTTLEKELSEYKSIIPEFFSKDAEGSNIRALYEKMEDKTYSDKKINLVDLSISESVYDDYLNGMYTFVSDLNTAVITESDVDTYSDKLNSAREKDSMFIESIFGGTLNPVEESTLKEATDSLEVLINLIPKIDTFYNKSVILSESMKNDNALISSSVEMICESVGNYTYNMIKHVMDTYYDVMESFNDTPDTDIPDNFTLY